MLPSLQNIFRNALEQECRFDIAYGTEEVNGPRTATDLHPFKLDLDLSSPSWDVVKNNVYEDKMEKEIESIRN